MRTDSVNLSDLALAACKSTVISLMGERYVKTRQFATKTKGAQEAHEAIRPTDMSNEDYCGNVTGAEIVRIDLETYCCITDGRG